MTRIDEIKARIMELESEINTLRDELRSYDLPKYELKNKTSNFAKLANAIVNSKYAPE